VLFSAIQKISHYETQLFENNFIMNVAASHDQNKGQSTPQVSDASSVGFPLPIRHATEQNRNVMIAMTA